MSNTIWCVGRNYLEHAKELGNEVPSSPLIFIKSWGSINKTRTIELPFFSNHIEHEIELALKLNDQLEPAFLALALDLTARDIQTIVKAKGHPWTLAKSFKGSCLISEWISFKGETWFDSLVFELSVNNVTKQKGETKDMIFKIPQLIHYLKKHYTLLPNDIILTGTPSGVGKLNNRDELIATIKGELTWKVQVEKNPTE